MWVSDISLKFDEKTLLRSLPVENIVKPATNFGTNNCRQNIFLALIAFVFGSLFVVYGF